jgi:hypothetical protein
MAFHVGSKQRRKGDGGSIPRRQFNAFAVDGHVPGRLCTTGKKNSFPVPRAGLDQLRLKQEIGDSIVAFGVVE